MRQGGAHLGRGRRKHAFMDESIVLGVGPDARFSIQQEQCVYVLGPPGGAYVLRAKAKTPPRAKIPPFF